MNQTHVSDLFTKTWSNFCKVSRKTKSHSPRLIFSSLNDQRHNESFVLVFGQYFCQLFERFSCQDSDLILLVRGSVFKNTDQIWQNELFFINFAKIRYFWSRCSLEKKHFFVWNVRKFASYYQSYCRIFSLFCPARGYTLHMSKVADTRQVKLA